jgi:hypothetical protein
VGVGIIGYIILIASPIPGLSYAAVFLAACGIYPLVRRQRKRSEVSLDN